MCSNVWKAPGFIKRKADAPLHTTAIPKAASSSDLSSSGKCVQGKAPEKSVAAPAAKSKFSFLNKLGTSSASSSAAKQDNKDFMAFNATSTFKGSALTQANSNSLQALSKGIFARAAPPTAPTGTLNLLELEALNKKKKRKSLGGSA